MDLDILVIGAHPDDAEIGCGGTIAHYKKRGKKIGVLDLSNGEPTPFGTVEKRLEETKKASDILRLDVRITLDMTNRYIENTIENRKKVSEVIRKYKPPIIITHPPYDWHPDHISCHQIVNAAKFQAKLTKTESKYPEYSPKYVFYFDHSHLKDKNRKLDFLIDISDSLEEKINALKAYKSQFFDNKKHIRIFDYIKERAGYLGYQIGVKYAEGFITSEYLQMDFENFKF
ncbi:MAG: bacillithiol biosynthesis deacetylase BshB1 [Promethearchaeota archaeon]|jgi:bacillithiol biosynthesis deacetylase BshB1